MNQLQGNTPTFDIFGEFEKTRQSLKKREFILKVTFSLPSPSSMLKLPNYLSSHLVHASATVLFEHFLVFYSIV